MNIEKLIFIISGVFDLVLIGEEGCEGLFGRQVLAGGDVQGGEERAPREHDRHVPVHGTWLEAGQ